MCVFAVVLVFLSTTQAAALSLGLRAAGARRCVARACAAETPAVSPPFVSTSNIEAFPVSPPMNLSKYETMQKRRTEVTVNYAGGGGWAAMARETIDIVKGLHPDVRVRRVITSAGGGLQVKVDGTTIAASNRDDSIFLSLSRIDRAVERARQRRRPARTVYAAAPTEAADGKEQRKAERRAQLQAAASPPRPRPPAPASDDE